MSTQPQHSDPVQSLISDLNPQQRRAAIELTSNTLVTACPGSGKTKMLASKAALILANPANRLCAVTFTREGALELRHRIDKMAGEGARPRLLVGTFHSICSLQTGPKPKSPYGKAIFEKMAGSGSARAQIATEGERRTYVRRAIELAEMSGLINEEQAVEAIERIKAGADEDPRFPPVPAGARKVARIYQSMLKENAQIDFQDILTTAVESMAAGAISPLPVTHMLVDEFQDTDAVQYRWIDMHAQAGVVITAVGDDDQSIYGWRRALGKEGMDKLMKPPVNAVRISLGTNYRCRAEILVPAKSLIRYNSDRNDKALESARGPGGSVKALLFTDETSEALSLAALAREELAAGKSVAVLARANRLLNVVETELAIQQVPYVRPGAGSIFDKIETNVFGDLINLACGKSGSKGVDNVLHWVRVPEQDVQKLRDHFKGALVDVQKAQLDALGLSEGSAQIWSRLAKRMTQWIKVAQKNMASLLIDGIEAWMLEHVNERYKGTDDRSRSALDYYSTVIRCASQAFGALKVPLANRVEDLKRRSMQAKANEKAGGPAVVLMTMHGSKGLEWDVVWIVRAEESVIPDPKGAVEEERRLMYVAITRARDHLVVSSTSEKSHTSRFVVESRMPVRRVGEVARRPSEPFKLPERASEPAS